MNCVKICIGYILFLFFYQPFLKLENSFKMSSAESSFARGDQPEIVQRKQGFTRFAYTKVLVEILGLF